MAAPGTATTDFHRTITAMFERKGRVLAYINRCRSAGKGVLSLGIHKRDPLPVYSFFKEVVSKRPWVRVNVHDDPVDAMKVGFSVKASFEPRRYLWDFGDGQKRSPVAAPEHRYEKPGMYTVKVAIWLKKDKHYVRSIQLQIPRIRLGARPPATAPE